MNTFVILAGGRSSRMGKDKTFLTYQGKTFLEHLIDRGSGVFDRILISGGNREHTAVIKEFLKTKGYDRFAVPLLVIPDLYDSIGPMGGLLSVFETVQVKSFVLTAVDLPLADMQVLKYLAEYPEEEKNTDGIMPAGPAAIMLSFSNERIEPCAAVYHEAAYSLLKAAFSQGCFSLFRALGTERIRVITAEQLKKSNPALAELDFETAFRNFNTAEELEMLPE